MRNQHFLRDIPHFLDNSSLNYRLILQGARNTNSNACATMISHGNPRKHVQGVDLEMPLGHFLSFLHDITKYFSINSGSRKERH